MLFHRQYVPWFVLIVVLTIFGSLILFTPTEASEPAMPVVAPLAQYDCGYLVGEIRMWTGDTPPDGWLIANGQAINRTQYADLFSVVGTKYGAGDGTTTFNLPNLSGKFPLGASSGHALATTGGQEQVTLTVAQMPSHSHSFDYNRMSVGYGTGAAMGFPYGFGLAHWPDDSTSSVGNGQPHNNMPPYLTINYIIRVSNGHQQ
jgi:microcystin-dependent protein